MLQSAELGSQSVRNSRHYTLNAAAQWTLRLALVSFISTLASVWAQSAAGEARIEFSIPEQPLVAAISRYAEATGSEAVYDASLVVGRNSKPVQGLLTPTEALERLLAGTGLSARFVAEGMFVVVPAQAANGQSIRPGPSPSAANRRYYALMQESLLDALCRSSGARPGRYRIIAVFSITPTGPLRRRGESAVRVTQKSIARSMQR
jgi:hypothetical protein